MNSSDQRAEQIFALAVGITDPAARRACLEQACAGDAQLLAEVESLLAAHEQADAFMRTDVAPATNLLTSTEKSGDRIGRCKLLEQIGEGGFGAVWMAEQEEPVRRRVALKIIKLGMDTREVVARFEAERQALALMDHPNIARVFDGGATESGRPYFVMELVRGIPITKFCDEHKLTTTERLELFFQVCQAVQHAHQKGIIHRDLKPSNILVWIQDDRPTAKVIDFGIAKATEARLTEKTLFTRFNQLIGTPAYMSPEQAGLGGLDIDTRSDIYSLGVLLYELLTGRTPFDAKKLLAEGYDAILRTIREVDPPKPSTRLSTLNVEELRDTAAKRRAEPQKLNRIVRGDLDWIVMKCLEKDRARRYETANGLLLDLKRFLSGEPIVARPPSNLYRLQKLARRNKTAFAAAAAVVFTSVSGVVVSTWQAVLANRSEFIAKERLSESEALSKSLMEIFQSPDQRSAYDVKVSEILAPAAQKLETESAIPPERRARLQAILGNSHFALGLYREAIPLQEKARDYFLSKLGPEDPETLLAQHNLANSYRRAGRFADALKLQEEVVPLFRKVLGTGHRDTLKAMDHLAGFHFESGHRAEALNMREELVLLCRKALDSEDTVTLDATHNLATSYLMAGRFAEAIKLQEEVLSLGRKVKYPAMVWTMNNLALSYLDSGRKEEGLRLQEEVLSLRRKVNGPEHPLTVKAIYNLGRGYDRTGRREDALRVWREAVEFASGNPNSANDFYDMGQILMNWSSYIEAASAFRVVLKHAKTLNEDLVTEAALRVRMADCLAVGYAACPGAEQLLLDFLADVRRTIANHPENSEASKHVALLLAWMGKDAERRELCAELISRAEKSDDAPIRERAAKAFLISPKGNSELLKRACALARDAFSRALSRKANPGFVAWFKTSAGIAAYRQEQFADAESLLTEVVNEPSTATDCRRLAMAFRSMSYARLGRPTEAKSQFVELQKQLPTLPNRTKLSPSTLRPDELTVFLAYEEAQAVLVKSEER